MKKEFTYRSFDGKTKLHTVLWYEQRSEYKGIVQIIHGMQEYVARYEEFAEHLTSLGYLVVGHDQLGHGWSSTEENLGFFAKEDAGRILIEDIHKLRCMMQKKLPALPYFMLGHSMGSYLLRRYLCSFGAGLSGAIIVGTGMVPAPATTFGRGLCHLLALPFGWHHRSKLVTGIAFGPAYHRFDEEGPLSWLTKERQVVQKYSNEKRCRFLFTLNGYHALFETVEYAGRRSEMKKLPRRLPVLIASGEDDPVGNFGKNVKKVYDRYQRAGLLDVTLKLYPGDRHEILNETDRQQVYQDLSDWLGSK